ncbi:retropepsin-like aspartic protease family protein [Dongia rigui]|uniref:TIGR02281 family clan AA aspartic protease n=1 Tax=Dongia rigui TaxID=940149 RepID=A0ABU5E155_9PROT|nr:TIGR02281 family clan AA aspartic protease [Dongia rigui]MDY0872959.1 TIGR02281 family clan AA aspartic protease [Dongia rigui]
MRGGRYIGLFGVVALAIGAFLLYRTSPDALADADNRLRVIYLACLLAAGGGGLWLRLRVDTSRTVAQFGIWVAIFCGLILLYSFRNDFGALGTRLSGELMPRDGRAEGDQMMSYPLAENGHFQVHAEADGTPLDFMIDSGATNVVLTPAAARRLGYDLDALQFDKMAQTANGYVRGATIMIGEFKVGNIVMHDLPATVNSVDMSSSLLGMDFLKRLKSWRVEGERITLEQ